MRRPVKPFVTEYKGNARRSPSPSMKLEEDTPPPRASEPSRFLSIPQSEDSYEAALRAADALFSGQNREASPDASADVDGGEPSSSAKGGRILRVIDEAPSRDVIDLETERAPKRRGRKPGSKNKPKIVHALLSDVSDPRREISSPVLALSPAPAIPANQNGAIAVDIADLPTVATGARRGERYAWVRTQLKPGQSWKRHLPKVIW